MYVVLKLNQRDEMLDKQLAVLLRCVNHVFCLHMLNFVCHFN